MDNVKVTDFDLILDWRTREGGKDHISKDHEVPKVKANFEISKAQSYRKFPIPKTWQRNEHIEVTLSEINCC